MRCSVSAMDAASMAGESRRVEIVPIRVRMASPFSGTSSAPRRVR